jgi:hypothetical protein
MIVDLSGGLGESAGIGIGKVANVKVPEKEMQALRLRSTPRTKPLLNPNEQESKDAHGHSGRQLIFCYMETEGGIPFFVTKTPTAAAPKCGRRGVRENCVVRRRLRSGAGCRS